MGTVILERSVSEEEYLKNPAFEHHEYVDGAVVERHLGSKKHSRLQGRIVKVLLDWADQHPDIFVGPELHCQLMINGERRYRIPDIAVVARPFEGPYLEGAPELVVEILSPEDSINDAFDKFDEYFGGGCTLGWLVLPEDEAIWAISPERTVSRFCRSDTLTGFHLLPGFQVPVDSIFKQL
jgi:Uma2 family endonuclease